MFKGKGYDAIIRELFAYKRLGIRPAIGPVRKLLRVLGDPHKKTRFFHVAGTNGKGSTTAMIASIMAEAGYKTGAFYSPHVYDYRERFLINGGKVSKKEIAETLRRMGAKWSAAKKKDRRLPEKITFFEWTTALAFCLFARRKVDAAVMETGMGGSFDATNVITPEVTVITNISLEHTPILGKTKAAIAGEKAGILKRRKPLVCGEGRWTAREALRRSAILKGSPGFFLGEDFRVTPKGAFFSEYMEALNLKPSMPGAYQIKNAAVAAQAVLCAKRFSVTKRHIRRGIEKAELPGRFETVKGKRKLIFDVAHNPAAFTELAKLIRETMPDGKINVVIGILRGKDYRKMLKTIAPVTRRMYCVTPPDERAIPAETLDKAGASLGIRSSVVRDVEKALKGSSPVLVTGSFTTVDYLKANLPRDRGN